MEFEQSFYMCKLAWRLKLLEDENMRLRQTVFSSNEEIFTLKAIAVTVEAELKYSAELEVSRIESELKFKVCEVLTKLFSKRRG